MNTIGKDLSAIRKHLNLDLEDIHHKTRIPLETLIRIEDDSLLSDPNENIIYVRSFIRTYTKALKIDPELVVKALDQSEVGNYNGLLLESYPELLPARPSSSESEEDESVSKSAEDEQEKKPKKTPVTSPKPTPETIRSKQSETRPSQTSKVQKDDKWAQVGQKMSTGKKSVPVWLIGVIVIIIITLIALFIILDSDSFGSNDVSQFEPGETTGTNGAELRLDFPETEPEPEPSPPATLQDTLYLTLYAAYDKMEPVRVWSDLKPRIDPYWIEQGVAMNFEFRDTIRITGQYERMLLFLNGHRIDNFRQNYFNQSENAVELTRDIFTEPEADWAGVISMDLPEDAVEPDSIVTRPAF
jgi:hypothetical protein